MEADFSGWATKAGLKCSDGRTIMPGAFRQQDQTKVPLVWQHGHGDPENVLGHAILEYREQGIYAYGFFNKTPKAQHAHGLLEHGDINALSIWANELVERSGKVLHGAIREVSLVLAGANPGALIENVTIRHGEGDYDTLDDEAIIHTGLPLEHENMADPKTEEVEETKSPELVHADGDANDDEDDDEAGETVQDVLESMSEKQKEVVHFLISEAMKSAVAEIKDTDDGDAKQDSVGTADDENTIQHDNTDNPDNQEGNTTMAHNIFEQDKTGGETPNSPSYTLTHSDVKGIVADATKVGSLKDAVTNFALAHGIDDIDILFPEAQALMNTPEFDKRRTEWVANVLGNARKSPFSRVKTLFADLTEDEARAKGYITGNLKKEEFFSVAKRVTTPTTIYKKQKLDRDDMVDITDFDVVAWLKSEMRLMLDEELARAILIGDGRDVASEDKINEGNIRPIATDHVLYATTVNVNIDDANSSVAEVIDAIIRNRKYFKGTGTPTMYTTETLISEFMVLKDGVNRRLYKSLDEVAAELRVREIVPVEVMEEEADILAIIVNLQDYVIGADKGGQVSMFDDFDIDYNQYKYLIETRVSGALAKLKSALVFRKVASTAVAVEAAAPTFDGTEVTIVTTANVKYFNAADDSEMTAVGSPYEVPAGTAIQIYAVADSGYYFTNDRSTTWTFRNRA